MSLRTAIQSITLAIATTSVTLHAQQQTPNGVLKDAYAISKQADSEPEYTLIIDKLSGLSPEKLEGEVRAYRDNLLAWALNRRGEIFWDRMKAPDDADGLAAAKDFNESYKLKPDRWRTKQNVAFVLASEGKLKDAEKLLDDVVELNPNRANTVFNRGELRFEQGKLAAAIEDYSRAITLSPKEADFYSSRAHARYRLGQVDLAIEDYRDAVSLDSVGGSRSVDLADALQSVARWQEAIRVYRTAIANDPQNIRAQLNLAWLLATAPDPRARNGRESLEIINAIQNVPADEQFRFIDTHAAALAEVRDFKSAVRVASTAQNLVPEQEKASFKDRLAMYRSGRNYRQTIPNP